MKIDFTGRGTAVSDQLRDYTQNKMGRLVRHFSDIRDISAVLSVEKYRHRVEIKFFAQKKGFHGAEETSDMFQSVDRVVDKLEAQVKKFKEKKTTKKRHTTDTIRASAPPLNGSAAAPAESRRSEIKVVRTSPEVKPMNLEEALEELEKLNQEFIIFRNADNEHVNVVYRRKDGHIGLIEPGN